jgi:hypothetical protein
MIASLTAGTGVTLSYSNPVLNIGPGATLNTTLTAATTSSTAEGTYNFNATATSGGNSDVTNTNASLTVQIAPPATPTGVSATAVTSGNGKNKSFQYIRVQWGAVAGATSYDIQRCKVSGKGGGATCVYAPLTSTAGTSINDVPPTTGTYKYQVKALNSVTGLSSNWSAAAQATR